jgi:hypothetical protein
LERARARRAASLAANHDDIVAVDEPTLIGYALDPDYTIACISGLPLFRVPAFNEALGKACSETLNRSDQRHRPKLTTSEEVSAGPGTGIVSGDGAPFASWARRSIRNIVPAYSDKHQPASKA